MVIDGQELEVETGGKAVSNYECLKSRSKPSTTRPSLGKFSIVPRFPAGRKQFFDVVYGLGASIVRTPIDLSKEC